MGLFVLDLEKRQTRKSLVTAAISNLKLYLEELEAEATGTDYKYLLEIAHNQLALAIKTPPAGKEKWRNHTYRK